MNRLGHMKVNTPYDAGASESSIPVLIYEIVDGKALIEVCTDIARDAFFDNRADLVCKEGVTSGQMMRVDAQKVQFGPGAFWH